MSPLSWIEPVDLAWPGPEDLLAAIRGQHVGPHPIAGWAHQLGLLHTTLLDHPLAHETRSRRTRVIDAIDSWLQTRLPPPRPDARVYPESVGVLVDRIAATQVRAWRLLMTHPANDARVHESWSRLAVLVEDYVDLVTGLDRRTHRLPTVSPLLASA
ncbi:DUF4254 domain-containing protein [Nocardia puris]|uniref:DUF4254 domain-containing protein n=1 Tax=Nocardia puris TaxID=208602 RepID=UPI00082FA4D3|nr:DUF4254 domain-containing protein [Nocardia puris]